MVGCWTMSGILTCYLNFGHHLLKLLRVGSEDGQYTEATASAVVKMGTTCSRLTGLNTGYVKPVT